VSIFAFLIDQFAESHVTDFDLIRADGKKRVLLLSLLGLPLLCEVLLIQQKNILWFDISMDNVFRMEMSDTRGDLYEEQMRSEGVLRARTRQRVREREVPGIKLLWFALDQRENALSQQKKMMTTRRS
jgi:hypothetical protein